jgi:hypothetical protein
MTHTKSTWRRSLAFFCAHESGSMLEQSGLMLSVNMMGKSSFFPLAVCNGMVY